MGRIVRTEIDSEFAVVIDQVAKDGIAASGGGVDLDAVCSVVTNDVAVVVAISADLVARRAAGEQDAVGAIEQHAAKDADGVAQNHVVVAADDDAVVGVAGDDVLDAGRGAADRVAIVLDVDSDRVGDGAAAGEVRADVVAEDRVHACGGKQFDAVGRVA